MNSLGWKDLEDLLLYRMRQHDERGEATMSRYGVQASMRKDEQGVLRWAPISSLPDFEGVLRGGRQFVVEAKVVGAASLPIHDDKFKERQLKHLLKRADYGAISIVLIHFNERKLKTKTVEPATFAFPVHRDHPFWEDALTGGTKNINRGDCEEYAIQLAWNTITGLGSPRPDLFAALDAMHQRQQFWLAPVPAADDGPLDRRTEGLNQRDRS